MVARREFGRAANLRRREPVKMWANPFDGAGNDAYSSRYAPYEQSPDDELSMGLPALRARSADLVRNDPIAYGILDVICRNVVGTGPRFRSTHPNPEISDKLDAFFSEWRKVAGWDGVSAWKQVCDGIIHAANVSGDVLVLWPDVGDGTGPRIDVVDARRIDTPSTHPEAATCRLGVGYDKYGRVLGYYVRKDADVSGGADRDKFYWFPARKNGRVNAFLFKRPGIGRPRQSRGIPLLAPAIHDLKDCRDYRRTEVRRAAQAAKVVTIIKTPDPKAIADAFENATISDDSDQSLDQLLGRAYGNTPDGTIMSLGLGEDAIVVQPPPVNSGFGGYIESINRAIAPCTGYPAEEVFRLWKDINFSNAKAIQLLSKAATRDWREDFSPILEATARLMIQYAWATGALGRIPFSAELYAHKWSFDEREWIDLAKEVKANAEAVQTSQRSIVEICASVGRNVYEVVDENLAVEKYEAEQRAKLGIPKMDPKATAQPDPEETKEKPEDPSEDDDV